MRIIAQDANAPNPYMKMLYGGLRDLGVQVDDLKLPNPLGPTPDIIHIHWPEHLYGRHGAAIMTARYLNMRLYLAAKVRSGAKIVWTLHNVRAHERVQPRFEKTLTDFTLQHVSGWLTLTESGAEEIRREYPVLAKIPSRVVIHGHYRGYYPETVTREEARRELGIASDAKVALFFGRVRPYKGLDTLLDVFTAPGMAEANRVLLIAGQGEYPQELLAGRYANIRVFPGFVPDERVQYYFRAADMGVFPFRFTLNSGTALLTLSFGLPVLAPALGSLLYYEQEFGPEAVRLYEGEMTADRVAIELDRAAAKPLPPLDMSHRDWTPLVRQTYDFFRSVAGK